MATKKTSKPEFKVEEPTQLSIWDVLEHPEFEKNLSEEMKLLQYAGENYSVLKQRVDQQYKKDIATLELAKDNQMQELLSDYKTPADFTVVYVEIITKKVSLTAHKRDLVKRLFESVVKRTAINIINEKAKEAETCAESSSQKDLNK